MLFPNIHMAKALLNIDKKQTNEKRELGNQNTR